VTSSDALKQADLALYTSKRDGRDTFRIYEPSMLSKVRVRNKMLQLARRVLEEGYVRPYFQPKVDLLSSRIVGFEALLRCGLPGGELFGPLRIAAALEDRRLATELSCRILDAVIEQMVIWRRAGLDFGHVAINASVSDLNQPAFASKLLQRVAAAGLEPGVIQIEITESVLLGRNASLVMKTLETLHDAGIKLALDDFGTGFASLSHLKLATIDIIKIDKTFVRNLHANDEDAAIVRALIEVAKALNLEVVTEGVETGDQCSLLAIAGCETGQGFYFSRPLPGEEITGLLASRVEAVAA
jgi:EAL domain-containing protein (putative c-di-GMP-specific phosphodiesterase class I)